MKNLRINKVILTIEVKVKKDVKITNAGNPVRTIIGAYRSYNSEGNFKENRLKLVFKNNQLPYVEDFNINDYVYIEGYFDENKNIRVNHFQKLG